FTADAQKHWTHHTISADRANWAPAQTQVNWQDPSPKYTLALGTLRKNVSLVTNPAGAQVSLNGQDVGRTPLKLSDVPFPADPATARFIPQRIVISKAGYDPLNAVLNWDGGKTDYAVDLPP